MTDGIFNYAYSYKTTNQIGLEKISVTAPFQHFLGTPNRRYLFLLSYILVMCFNLF